MSEISKTTKEKEHIHSFKRDTKLKTKYRCMGATCYALVDKTRLLGKANKCRCGNVFILTGEDLKRAIPRCLECSDTVRSRRTKAVEPLVAMSLPPAHDNSNRTIAITPLPSIDDIL